VKRGGGLMSNTKSGRERVNGKHILATKVRGNVIRLQIVSNIKGRGGAFLS